MASFNLNTEKASNDAESWIEENSCLSHYQQQSVQLQLLGGVVLQLPDLKNKEQMVWNQACPGVHFIKLKRQNMGV